MSGIAIVSPGFPDRAGGVTDHTARLTRHWGRERRVVTYGTAEGDPEALAEAWRRADEAREALLIYSAPRLVEKL